MMLLLAEITRSNSWLDGVLYLLNDILIYFTWSYFSLTRLLFLQLFIDLEESIFDLKTYFDFKGRFPYLRFSSQSKYLYRKKWFSSTKIKLQILSNKNKNFSNTGRQFFSRPTLYVSQSAYLPFDHSVTLLLCYSVTLSFFHFVTVSLCYSVTPSLCNSVTLSLNHSVTPSLCHIIILSHCHSVPLLLCHSVTLSLCHSVTMSDSLALSLSQSLSPPLRLSPSLPHSPALSLAHSLTVPFCQSVRLLARQSDQLVSHLFSRCLSLSIFHNIFCQPVISSVCKSV